MGKGKQRKRQKKIEQQMQKIPICQNTVTAEEWTHIIANALMEVDKKKALLLEAEREKNLEIWHQALGIKDHSKDRNPKKIFFIFFESIRAMPKMYFIPKEKVRGDQTTFSLLQLVAKFGFSIASIVLLVIALYGVVVHPIIIAQYLSGALLWSGIFCVISWGLAALILSLIFHIASLEVDNMEDRQYLFSLISSITAIISMVLSIVTLLNK